MAIKRFSILAFLIFPIMAQAQSSPKYFGYFGDDYQSTNPSSPGPQGPEEMKDHVNLYTIGLWSGRTTPEGKAGSEVYVLGELAKAKAAHIHAIVPATPFVYQGTGDGCRYMDQNAARDWSSFAQKMVDQGYLIPGDTERSTVVAVYILDEPNGAGCVADVGSSVNPIFQNGVSAVRQNALTASLPLAATLTRDFDSNFTQGIKLLDWVGFDYYPYNNNQWSKKFATLKAMTPGKKYIVVPGAMTGCHDVTKNDPTAFINAMNNDPLVVWLAPFAWYSPSATCNGVRDIPDLLATYRKEGKMVKDALCAASPAEKWFCGKSVNISGAVNYLLDN